MAASKRRRRLNVQAWREVLRRFDAAGVTVGEFCKREGVGQSSFHRWRSRLVSPPSNGSSVHRKESSGKTPATFVELGALGATAMTARLDLRLDLGGGLSLHLVRS